MKFIPMDLSLCHFKFIVGNRNVCFKTIELNENLFYNKSSSLPELIFPFPLFYFFLVKFCLFFVLPFFLFCLLFVLSFFFHFSLLLKSLSGFVVFWHIFIFSLSAIIFACSFVDQAKLKKQLKETKQNPHFGWWSDVLSS